MTKEGIKKAAGDYSGSILGFTDNKSVMEKHKAFADGAQWRINSVWHDVSETPISGKEALVKYITGDLKIKYRVDVFCGYEWKEMCHYDKLLQFAYIEDLIPNKEN